MKELKLVSCQTRTHQYKYLGVVYPLTYWLGNIIFTRFTINNQSLKNGLGAVVSQPRQIVFHGDERRYYTSRQYTQAL